MKDVNYVRSPDSAILRKLINIMLDTVAHVALGTAKRGLGGWVAALH